MHTDKPLLTGREQILQRKRQQVYDELIKYVDADDAAYAAERLVAMFVEPFYGA